MPNCPKKKIFDTVILPSMTYGAETWTLTKRQENKPAVAQRSIQNVTRQDRIRNAINRERTKVKDVIERIRSMKGQ